MTKCFGCDVEFGPKDTYWDVKTSEDVQEVLPGADYVCAGCHPTLGIVKIDLINDETGELFETVELPKQLLNNIIDFIVTNPEHFVPHFIKDAITAEAERVTNGATESEPEDTGSTEGLPDGEPSDTVQPGTE